MILQDQIAGKQIYQNLVKKIIGRYTVYKNISTRYIIIINIISIIMPRPWKLTYGVAIIIYYHVKNKKNIYV